MHCIPNFSVDAHCSFNQMNVCAIKGPAGLAMLLMVRILHPQRDKLSPGQAYRRRRSPCHDYAKLYALGPQHPQL